MPVSKSEAVIASSSPAIAVAFNRWINSYRLRHPDISAPNTWLAEVMHINEASWSQIRRGKRRPLPEQCLRIAHILDVPLDEVLRLEGYPTVPDLILWLKKQPITPAYVMDQFGFSSEQAEARASFLQNYALTMLQYSLDFPKWRAQDWRNAPSLQYAEEILASDRSNTDKAVRYADIVYDWAKSLERERDESRWVRHTGEHAFQAS